MIPVPAPKLYDSLAFLLSVSMGILLMLIWLSFFRKTIFGLMAIVASLGLILLNFYFEERHNG